MKKTEHDFKAFLKELIKTKIVFNVISNNLMLCPLINTTFVPMCGTLIYLKMYLKFTRLHKGMGTLLTIVCFISNMNLGISRLSKGLGTQLTPVWLFSTMYTHMTLEMYRLCLDFAEVPLA